MNTKNDPKDVVVVTGPVGGGKSTLGAELTKHVRMELAQTAAVIDLDEVYKMLRSRGDFDEQPLWPIARRGCAALAESFFNSGFDVVVVEGEFFSTAHFDELRAGFGNPPRVTAFTLMVSYDQALQRVRGDPARGASKNPGVLKELHNTFIAALPYLRERTLILDAEHCGAVELARMVASQLENRSG
jgi:hypothetical protein